MKANLIIVVCVLFFPLFALADDDEGYEGHEGAKQLTVVANNAYKKTCGSCHFAYQPGLLPSKSWLRIIDEPNAHPGGALILDEKTKTEVKNYLIQNSAEQSHSKKSKKIIASIKSDTLVRITEIPYIKQKHHNINQAGFGRKAVGSRANCIACHRSAESGVYNEEDTVIPE